MASEPKKTEDGIKAPGGKGANCAGDVSIALPDSVLTSLKDRPVTITFQLTLERVRYDGEERLRARVSRPKLKRVKRENQ